MPTDTSAPLGTFGATGDGVKALIPAATLYDGALPTGRAGVTIAQVTAWILELTGSVARRLDGWERLEDVVNAPNVTSDRAQLIADAAGLVHNGAASYVEAARYPEATGKATDTYAAVLWARFTAGLDELAAWLTRRLELGDASARDDGGDGGDAVAFSFPAPSFTADRQF